MLDLKFKGLKCVIHFFDLKSTKCVVAKYGTNLLVPMLMKYSHFFNLIVASTFHPLAHCPSIHFLILQFQVKRQNERIVLQPNCLLFIVVL
jgi:hypothetical protein